MVEVRFERVNALPAVTTPNTLYFVKPTGSDVVFQYASGSSGPALPVVSPDTAGPLLALFYQLLERIEALEDTLENGGIDATIENTLGSSELLGSAVSSFVVLTNLLDDRLVTVGA